MAWTGLMLTVKGRSALNQAQQSNRINFKSIVVGDGMPPSNFSTLNGLVHQLYELTELKVDMTENGCTLTADFPKTEYDYYFREVGVIAETENGEILYVYDNCGDDAQLIVNSTGAETTQKRLRLSLMISDVSEITVTSPGLLYVSYDDFEKTVQELEQTDAGLASALQEEQERAVERENQLEAHLQTETARAKDAEEANADAIEREKSRATAAEDSLKKILDTNKPVWDGAYQQAAGYMDQKIAELINGAPDTLDTLGEIAHAMEDNADVVEALENAIGTKADQKEMERLLSAKLDQSGDAKDNTVTYISGDAASPSRWTDVPVLQSGEKFSVIMNRVSTMFKNVRYLFKMLGTTDISAIGGGTVTGAVSKLNTDLGSKQNNITGGASTIASSNLTANRSLVSNANGKVAVSAVTAAELGYLDGVTSNVQTQINNLSKRIAVKHVTLKYSTSTILRGYAIFDGRAENTIATVEFTAGTPVNQVNCLAVEPGYGNNTSRVEIYAYGSGFVSGHLLDVFCVGFIVV